MSFLDSVLSSLGTGKPSPVPPSRPEPPVSSSNTKPKSAKPGTGPVPENGNGNVGAGTKRKAEAQLHRRPKPPTQGPAKTTASKPSTSSTPKSRPKPKPASTAKPPPNTSTSNIQKPSSEPAKAPPKGSFADLMAKATDLQQKTPTSVGTLKHQLGQKERLSKPERRKRIMEAKAKEKDARSGKKPNANPNAGSVRKREPQEPSYKGTSRPTQLTQPPQPPQPAYQGTAGLPSRGGPKDRKPQSKRSRMDDYLGTDEEDEGEYADDYDDYYSESSDMEAGLNDVEREEASALKSAQREDEEEWQAELAAKKEKMDRRNKLSSLVSRSK